MSNYSKEGFVTVKVLMYQKSTRSVYKIYEYGHSKIQPLNNKNQEERAFEDAVSNAGQKFAYHTQQKYSELEYDYDLLDSWITYIHREKKRKYYSEPQVVNLTPYEKRNINIKMQSRSKEERENMTQTRAEYNKMFKDGNSDRFKAPYRAKFKQKRTFKSVTAYRKEKSLKSNKKRVK